MHHWSSLFSPHLYTTDISIAFIVIVSYHIVHDRIIIKTTNFTPRLYWLIWLTKHALLFWKSCGFGHLMCIWLKRYEHPFFVAVCGVWSVDTTSQLPSSFGNNVVYSCMQGWSHCSSRISCILLSSISMPNETNVVLSKHYSTLFFHYPLLCWFKLNN